MLAKIAANEKAPYEEFPLNEDGSITITVLRKSFPNCVGIRYRLKPGGNLRGTKVYGDHLHLPVGVSWANHVFFCVYEDINEYEEEIDMEKERCLLEKYKLETYDMIALGLPDNISEEFFYQYFSKFGKLKLCELKKARRDTKSKGYGFLRYMDFTDQSVCMRTEHIISGAEVALRLPTTKMDSATCKKKLFVTSITPSVTMDDILEYFSIFGKINQIFMPPIDPPYAFVTFDVEDSIERILRFGDSHRIFGGYVVVERVYTKEEIREMNKVRSESVEIENSYGNNNEPHFNDRNTLSNDEQSAEQEYEESDRIRRLQFELDQQYHHQQQQQQQQQQQNFEQPHQQQYFENQQQHQPNFEMQLQQNYEHQQQHQQLFHQQQSQPVAYQNSQFLQQPPPNYPNQDHFPFQNEHQYQTYPVDQYDQYPSNHHEFPVDNYQYSPNENYLDAPHHPMNNGNVGHQAPRDRYCQETPSEIQAVSDVASRIVEQMSAQNEKDLLIRLLVDQLSSSSRPKVTSPDKLAKAMQLLQNPNILDNFIRFSESMGPDGVHDRKLSRPTGDRDSAGKFHRNPDTNP